MVILMSKDKIKDSNRDNSLCSKCEYKDREDNVCLIKDIENPSETECDDYSLAERLCMF